MAERDFLLPDPGEGLEEAEIVAWLVSEGDVVALNQPFVEVETAKATVEIPSPYAGRIAKLHADVGGIVRVGDVLVTFDIGNPADGAEERVSSSSVERGRPVAATPAVRRLARDRGVNLDSVAGSGPHGRITGDDVEATAQGENRPVASTASISADAVPITMLRRTIAERLTEVAAIPQVTTFRTVDCTELEAFRRELDVSPLPLLVSALARIGGDHPMLNASWQDDHIDVFRTMHVGVATDTARGLVVAVVRNAPSLGITAIAAEIRRLADAARSGTIKPEELVGSTITVTNTGSYGSEHGTPLLNPGNAVTLALGVVAPRALVVDGAVLARPSCTLSLTFDHRVLDGATAGRALTDLVACLQEAERLRDLPR
jgi:pyruvate dehydrogenase E2 component (dihydrolipoamide acetyltransferase)